MCYFMFDEQIAATQTWMNLTKHSTEKKSQMYHTIPRFHVHGREARRAVPFEGDWEDAQGRRPGTDKLLHDLEGRATFFHGCPDLDKAGLFGLGEGRYLAMCLTFCISLSFRIIYFSCLFSI